MRSTLSSSVAAGIAGVATIAAAVLAPAAPAATPTATTAATPAASTTATAATVPAATRPVPGTYVPVTAFRALDRRITHGHKVTARVGGRGHVPRRVAAVAITLTASSPTARGGLIAYPAGTKRPAPRNLLYSQGRNASVSGIVRMPTSGRLSIYAAAKSGTARVTLDVAGYYVAGTPASMPGVLHTVTPRHVLGSRSLGAHRNLVATMGGRAGVPRSGVGAVAVLVHAIAPTRSGSVVAYVAGGGRPHAPAATFVRGLDSVGFALVPVDSNGTISLYNASAGRMRVAVDVLGYTVGGIVTAAGTTQIGSPIRLVNGTHLKSRATRTVRVTGHAGLPSTRLSAVVVAVTAATAKRDGSAVAWQAAAARPHTTNLQFQAHDTASDTAIVPVSSSGTIAIRNVSRGTIALSVDVTGYVPAAVAPMRTPARSDSHYVRNLVPGDAYDNRLVMTSEGCNDAIDRSTLVLLDLGAQTVTAPLSASTPGVLLSGTTDKRLAYAELVDALTAYVSAFANCAAGVRATIVVSTNNDGDFDAYAADARGQDWATKVINPLRAAASSGITVVAGNDIEAGFASTREQAQTWEATYLQATSAGLIFNGSADGCSTTLGESGGTCAHGWTMQQIYDLAHNGSRIQVLPQVYLATQARQWANIDATGGGGLRFAGALTEFGACPVGASAGCDGLVSYTYLQGWTALYDAVSTVVARPSIPAATDLTVDD